MWQNLPYGVAILTFMLGIYCLLFKRNLIKIAIGLKIMSDGLHLLLLCLGYRAGGRAPILPEGEGAKEIVTSLATSFVDPLPQALVLTAIVIGVCVSAVALSLAVKAYQRLGVTDTVGLRGK
ncbi:sodium:proton antiporter [Neomoorella glycerini]|nr:sodium:proton antiporter [Moorella glycerini]